MRIALELKGWCTGVKGDWKKAAEIFEEVHLLTKHPLKGLTPLGCALLIEHPMYKGLSVDPRYQLLTHLTQKNFSKSVYAARGVDNFFS